MRKITTELNMKEIAVEVVDEFEFDFIDTDGTKYLGTFSINREQFSNFEALRHYAKEFSNLINKKDQGINDRTAEMLEKANELYTLIASCVTLEKDGEFYEIPNNELTQSKVFDYCIKHLKTKAEAAEVGEARKQLNKITK